MRKLIIALYSALAYLFFLGTFLHAIGFVEAIGVPKTIDSGAAGNTLDAVLIDLALLGVFAVQHSVMARQGFKRTWTRIIPVEAERSTYVLLASLALALLFWQWRALPQLMSLGHLLFAAATTACILIGIWLEERDLIAHFGRRYMEDRTTVGMLIPRLR